MRQIVVDIIKLTDEEMQTKYLFCRYRIKAYVYELDRVISYGVPEKDIKDYYIGKIINYKFD